MADHSLTQIIPPKWAAIYLAGGLVGHGIWLWKGGPGFPMPGLGGLILLVGFGVMFWAWKLFHIRGNPVCPFEETTHFIQNGPYRFTRNPMYLGMTMILTGIAFFAGTPPAFLAPVAFFLTVHTAFIPYEEKKMEAAFGKAYLDYKRRVRRWL